MIIIHPDDKRVLQRQGQKWAILGQLVLILLDEMLAEPVMAFEERTIKYRELLPRYIKARCEHKGGKMCAGCESLIDHLAKERDAHLPAVALVAVTEAANDEA